MELKELLFRLCAEPGMPGDETEAARFAAAELSRCGKTETDAMGNVLCHMGDMDSPRHVLLDAHLDQIGLIVTNITEDGFLRVARCGGVDRRVLPGAPVTIYGREILHGIVCSTPPHLSEGGEEKVSDAEKLAVDLGLSRKDAERLVSPGDRVSISFVRKKLLNGRIASAALDNRAGCAALIRCAELLSESPPACRLTILLSSREETGGQGARTAAFAANPTEAVAVDVSFADQPDVPPAKCSPLGSGAMIGAAPVLDKKLHARLVKLAETHRIPYTHDVMGGDTGTNSDAIAEARAGVKTALLSIPLRYMHTAVEVIDPRDVESVARLLAAFVREGPSRE